MQSFLDEQWHPPYVRLLRSLEIAEDLSPWPSCLPLLMELFKSRGPGDWRCAQPEVHSEMVDERIVFRIGDQLCFSIELTRPNHYNQNLVEMCHSLGRFFIEDWMVHNGGASYAHRVLTWDCAFVQLAMAGDVFVWLDKHWFDAHWQKLLDAGMGAPRLITHATFGWPVPACRWKHQKPWISLAALIMMSTESVDCIWTRHAVATGNNYTTIHSTKIESSHWSTQKKSRLQYKDKHVTRKARVSVLRNWFDAWLDIASGLPFCVPNVVSFVEA